MKLAIISPFPPYRGGISKETDILYNSLLENYDIQVPNSFEEWETRYSNSNNTQEWIDTGIFHPWISKNDLFITQNAYKIINLLTFDDKGLFTRKLIKCYTFL